MPNSPYIITFSEILDEHNLSEMEDYIFELKIEFALAEVPPYSPPKIIYEMKYFENNVWSGFIIHWPNFKIPNKNYAMNNPKIKNKQEQRVLTVFAFPSNDEKMPKTNEVKYLVCNENGEIIPGSLLEIKILYNEKNALSVPDTSIMYEGSKKFIYKIIENNIIKKTEIETGIRNLGNLEILSGLSEGDKIIAEGLTKVRSGMKVKPIIK